MPGVVHRDVQTQQRQPVRLADGCADKTHQSLAGEPHRRTYALGLRRHPVNGTPLTGYSLDWHDRGRAIPEDKKEKKNKRKYTCPKCSVNAWAKPDVSLLCGDCRVELVF